MQLIFAQFVLVGIGALSGINAQEFIPENCHAEDAGDGPGEVGFSLTDQSYENQTLALQISSSSDKLPVANQWLSLETFDYKPPYPDFINITLSPKKEDAMLFTVKMQRPSMHPKINLWLCGWWQWRAWSETGPFLGTNLKLYSVSTIMNDRIEPLQLANDGAMGHGIGGLFGTLILTNSSDTSLKWSGSSLRMIAYQPNPIDETKILLGSIPKDKLTPDDVRINIRVVPIANSTIQ